MAQISLWCSCNLVFTLYDALHRVNAPNIMPVLPHQYFCSSINVPRKCATTHWSSIYHFSRLQRVINHYKCGSWTKCKMLIPTWNHLQQRKMFDAIFIVSNVMLSFVDNNFGLDDVLFIKLNATLFEIEIWYKKNERKSKKMMSKPTKNLKLNKWTSRIFAYLSIKDVAMDEALPLCTHEHLLGPIILSLAWPIGPWGLKLKRIHKLAHKI